MIRSPDVPGDFAGDPGPPQSAIEVAKARAMQDDGFVWSNDMDA